MEGGGVKVVDDGYRAPAPKEPHRSADDKYEVPHPEECPRPRRSGQVGANRRKALAAQQTAPPGFVKARQDHGAADDQETGRGEDHAPEIDGPWNKRRPAA